MIKQKIFSKQRQITQRVFSKPRNAFSELEKSHLQELYRLRESKNKNYPVNDTLYFAESETTSHSSIQGKRGIKNRYKNKPVGLYNWNQPIKHIESYKLTVIKHKNEYKLKLKRKTPSSLLSSLPSLMIEDK